jgi:transglutaminase-like putative cysteine protease
MSLRKTTVRITGQEEIEIKGVPYAAQRAESRLLGQQMTFWLDAEGNILKEEGFLGLSLVRSSGAQAALGIAGSESDDLYELGAVKVEKSIQHPRRVSYLKLEMKGLEGTPFEGDVLNEGRQRYANGILRIRRESVPERPVYSLPYDAKSTPIRLYLRPEMNIESDNAAIVAKALEIAGETEAPVAAAKRLLTWVYGNVEKRPLVTIPSALEVLKTGVGDCNEHAVLLVGLLRAAGIPARVCVGLVYTRGRFFYHAWTEGYFGVWVSMDATLDQMPADATHIKLLHGGLERQVEVISLMGKLGLEVLDYKHD